MRTPSRPRNDWCSISQRIHRGWLRSPWCSHLWSKAGEQWRQKPSIYHWTLFCVVNIIPTQRIDHGCYIPWATAKQVFNLLETTCHVTFTAGPLSIDPLRLDLSMTLSLHSLWLRYDDVGPIHDGPMCPLHRDERTYAIAAEKEKENELSHWFVISIHDALRSQLMLCGGKVQTENLYLHQPLSGTGQQQKHIHIWVDEYILHIWCYTSHVTDRHLNKIQLTSKTEFCGDFVHL